jgi:murein DD-endopeptidase MepM/ murein hydrolase activator NlpD
MRSSYDGSAIRWRDALGLSPADQAKAAARAALRGDPYAPSVRFGLSSVRIFKPRISLATWLGRRRPDGRLPVYNLFNRNQPPPGSPYSVKVTTARDFQGGRWTYDSHAGTDFACPVGTAVVAAAPGMVVRVAQELDRGGLDVSVDHGGGLLTTHSHLSRADVTEGQVLRRGEVIGLSGAAGLEFVLFFPLVAPHLHYNPWLDGVPTDPFAAPHTDEPSLWRAGNDPVPHRAEPGGAADDGDEGFAPTAWCDDAIAAHTALIRDPAFADRVRALTHPWRQAAEILYARVFRGPVFDGPGPSLYPEVHERQPVLDLPFRAADVTGVVLPPAGR